MIIYTRPHQAYDVIMYIQESIVISRELVDGQSEHLRLLFHREQIGNDSSNITLLLESDVISLDIYPLLT